MKILKERRNPAAANLRVYIDAIKHVERMTNEEWIDEWISAGVIDAPYLAKSAWLNILKEWALDEAKRLAFAKVA